MTFHASVIRRGQMLEDADISTMEKKEQPCVEKTQK
jgi:hypothetical protein